MEKDLKPVEEMTDEERLEELTPYLKAAADKHLTIKTGLDIAGMDAVEIDTPVFVKADTFTIDIVPGTYFVSPNITGDPYSGALFRMQINDPDSFNSIVDYVMSLKPGDPISLDVSLEAVSLYRDRPISIHDVVAFLASGDAPTKEERERILRLAYPNIRFYDAEEPTPYKQDKLSIRKYTEPTTLVANRLHTFLPGQTTSLDVTGSGERRQGKSIQTLVSIDVDELGEDYSLTAPIDNYDRDIQGGLATLYEAGVRTFTVEQVARAMGYTSQRLSQATLADLEERIDKQRKIGFKINYEQEARGRRLFCDGEEISSYKLDGHLCDAIKVSVTTANGRIREGYVMPMPPLLLQHAKALGQVVTYKKSLLEAGEGRTTRQRLTVKRELARIVSELKNKKNSRSNKVTYAHLYDLAEINAEDRDARKTLNDFVISWLEDMTAAGEIKGYRETTRKAAGRDLREGVEIYV